MPLLEPLLLHPTDFGMSYFCFHISLGIFSILFWFLWWPSLFSNMLFNLHVFCGFSIIILVILNFISLWLEKMLDLISVLNLLRFGNMWSNLENGPCKLEISIKFTWSNTSLKSDISSLIFLSGWSIHCYKSPILLLYCFHFHLLSLLILALYILVLLCWVHICL